LVLSEAYNHTLRPRKPRSLALTWHAGRGSQPSKPVEALAFGGDGGHGGLFSEERPRGSRSPGGQT
jgi:hypothetical protein